VQLLSKDDVAAVISSIANRGSSSRRQGKVRIQRSSLWSTLLCKGTELSLINDAKAKPVLEREFFYGTGLLLYCRHLESGPWRSSMSELCTLEETQATSSLL
jgi:hypothetical protein